MVPGYLSSRLVFMIWHINFQTKVIHAGTDDACGGTFGDAAASASRAFRSRISAASSISMYGSAQSVRSAPAISAAAAAVSAWSQMEQNRDSGPPTVWHCGHGRGASGSMQSALRLLFDEPAIVLDEAAFEKGFPERAIRIGSHFVRRERGLRVRTRLQNR